MEEKPDFNLIRTTPSSQPFAEEGGEDQSLVAQQKANKRVRITTNQDSVNPVTNLSLDSHVTEEQDPTASICFCSLYLIARCLNYN